MSIPIIGKEEDVVGCVSAPVLLQEIVRSCSEQEALKKPVMAMLRIFAEMKKALDHELQRLKAFPNGEPQGSKETKEPTDDQAGNPNG